MLATAIASKSAGIEVEVVFLALVTDCEIVAVLAIDLTRLAGAPWRCQWERTHRT